MNRSRRGRAGFTFIELLTVVFILIVMAGVTIPIFRTSMNAVKVRSATRNFLATLTFSQEKAISSLYEHRVYFDKKGNAYWVERLDRYNADLEKVFVPVTESFGRKRALPDFLQIEDVHTKAEEFGEFPYIACYPNGACDKAEVQFKNTRENERIVVSTKGYLGKIEVENP